MYYENSRSFCQHCRWRHTTARRWTSKRDGAGALSCASICLATQTIHQVQTSMSKAAELDLEHTKKCSYLIRFAYNISFSKRVSFWKLVVVLGLLRLRTLRGVNDLIFFFQRERRPCPTVCTVSSTCPWGSGEQRRQASSLRKRERGVLLYTYFTSCNKCHEFLREVARGPASNIAACFHA